MLTMVRCTCVMNNPLRYSNVLLREYLSTPLFYAAIVLFWLLCAFGNSVEIDEKSFSVLELIYEQELYYKAKTDIQCSSYLLTFKYNSSPWFSVVVPVITAFPALQIYEQNSGNIRMTILIRMKTRQYSGNLFATSFLSGVFISSVGILLYALFIHLLFPPITAFSDDTLLTIYGSTAWERFVPFFKKCINCCLICGVFPVITMMLYHIIHDQFLSMTLPMMVQYISLKCSLLYATWLYSDGNRATDRLLNFWYLLFPSNCMYHCSFWENSLELPFACFFIVLGITIAVLYFLFEWMIRVSTGGQK